MKTFLTVLFTLAGLSIIMTIFALSGIYNISAARPHLAPVTRMIELARNRSISLHSRNVTVPAGLDNPKMTAEGQSHYHSMCRWCHGAPGFIREEFALGLYPSPPSLGSRDIQERTDREIFWIVKNGLKMTGMPAFGPIHNDEQLWTIAAFLRRLPKLPPSEYKSLLKEAAAHEHEKGEKHHHTEAGTR